MSVNDMRRAVANCNKYNKSDKWYYKVADMSDKQVTAVYYRLIQKGEL